MRNAIALAVATLAVVIFMLVISGIVTAISMLVDLIGVVYVSAIILGTIIVIHMIRGGRKQ